MIIGAHYVVQPNAEFVVGLVAEIDREVKLLVVVGLFPRLRYVELKAKELLVI